jgi:HK97 family phage portal protein
LGFWSFLTRPASVEQTVFTPRVTHVGSVEEWLAALDIDGMTASQLWRTQPHLRTVVSFRARNVAQLGLHVFRRVSDTDRQRDHDSPLQEGLRRPDVSATVYDLLFALVGDLDLYDRAYWLVGQSPEGRTMFRRLPPAWTQPVMSDAWTVKEYRVFRGDKIVTLPADRILSFTGYAPSSPVGSSPTVESLKDTLKEQIEAALYRGQVWKRGGRVSAVIERPAGAPSWSDAARESFREDWYAKYTGKGPKAGGTPLLEDGMTLKRIDFSAQDQQFVEGAKLALTTVAAAYHVNPTMIGVLDNANYSNVREFRRMLYGDTLGPLLAQIEARINTFLIPMLGMDPDVYYAEFNLQEKLQGSFEEQAAVMQTLVGRPIMTGDEGRAKFNLPALGGNMAEPVTPLNVLIGGQASPTDSGSQNRNAGVPQLKARGSESREEQCAERLASFFARQRRAVMSRLGAGREDVWDADRWDDELTEDLTEMYLATSEVAAREALADAGFGSYDVARTMAFLAEAARRSASDINETTRTAVAAAADDDDPTEAVASVFNVAEGQRAGAIAATTVTFASAFGTVEVARQNSDRATKTWQVESGNPRPSHAAMDGETVPIDEPFSNGLMWPGAVGDPDEVAGCRCSVVINF